MGEESPGARGLGRSFTRGAIYLGSANWLTYVVNFALTLGVARLVGPEVIGLYAFVVATNAFISIVEGFAVGPALIQSEDASADRYDTAFALTLAIGLAGLLVALCAAPWMAASWGWQAGIFLLILAVARIFRLLASIPQAQLERDIRYGSVALVALCSRNAPGLVGLGLAWAGYGIWSLIWRDLLFAILPYVLVQYIVRYRFGRRVTREAFRQILSFSGPMFLSRIVEIGIQRIDRLIVGGMLGGLALGFYHQARYVSEVGLLAMRPVNHLAFNLYSRVQGDPARLSRSYELLNFFLLRLMLAVSIAFFCFPTESIRLLLGSEWLEAAPALRILSVYGALFPLAANLRQLTFGRGKPMANARIRLAELALIVPGLALAGAWGSVEGVALTVVLGTVLSTALTAWVNASVVMPALMGISMPPLAALALTLAALLGSAGWGWREALPWWALPGVPPLLFGLAVLVIDRGRLLRELRYVRQLVGPARTEPTADAAASR